MAAGQHVCSASVFNAQEVICAVNKKTPNGVFLLFVYSFFLEDFFFGAFAPFFLASESPIATACLRLVTFLPDLPLFNVPFFCLRTAFLTSSPAFLLYLAIATPFLIQIRLAILINEKGGRLL